jgi:ribosomal-protein-alanine N-acetyltransferase
MDKAYRIRSAVIGDVESVLALDRAIVTLPHWRIEDYLAALPFSGRETGIGGICRCFFVAVADSAVVGFAVGKVMEAVAELESVGVTKRLRRMGVGRALCAAVIEWSERMGASEIELEVRSQSAGPIALYARLGFLGAGRRAKYYRDPVDDAVLMRLDLHPKARGMKASPGSTHGRAL